MPDKGTDNTATHHDNDVTIQVAGCDTDRIALCDTHSQPEVQVSITKTTSAEEAPQSARL